MLGERLHDHHEFTLDVRVPVGSGLPTTAVGYDMVLSLGAAPSVNDPDAQWWLGPHLELLQDANELGVPILGVCFGAQALAVALGGAVTRAAQPEVGWYCVDPIDSLQSAVGLEPGDADLIEPGPWLQWHVDAVTPPPGATVLATSPTCVQAYVIGPHLGVQFHPEVTTAEVAKWVLGDPGGPASAGNDGDAIVARFATELPAARLRANRLIDRFLHRSGLGHSRGGLSRTR